MLSEFDELKVTVPAKIEIIKSDENKVEILGSKHLINRIKITQNNRDVEIRLPTNMMFGVGFEQVDFKIYTTNTLSDLDLEGKIDLNGKNILAQSANLNVAGSVNTNLQELQSQVLKFVSNGSGETTLSGEITNTEFRLNGSSKLLARDLKTNNSIVIINGSGDIELNTSIFLNATINGSGKVNYLGEPQVIQTINGSGSIEKIN